MSGRGSVEQACAEPRRPEKARSAAGAEAEMEVWGRAEMEVWDRVRVRGWI